MNIILLSRYCRRKGSVEICVPKAAALFGVLSLIVGSLLVGLGYELGASAATTTAVVDDDPIVAGLIRERELVAESRVEMQAHLDALALRVGELQARLMRVDALGERLVSIGELDAKEFDFGSDPAMGGAVDPQAGSRSLQADELIAQIAGLNATLDDRERKLRELQSLLANRQLQGEVTVSGKPVRKGWMSSTYGHRTDPFNGKKTWHRGIDFAGEIGSEVVAVAAGVVVRAEREKGYGNLVEIKHADGYVTRYAHNDKNLVAVGDLVAKGQTIALLGKTGRANGPHVHFEVHRHGRSLNPAKFLKKG